MATKMLLSYIVNNCMAMKMLLSYCNNCMAMKMLLSYIVTIVWL